MSTSHYLRAGLVRLAGASVRSLWRRRRAYQTFLVWISTLLIVSGTLHTALWVLSSDSWTDPVSWRKPALFGLSFGLTGLSVAAIHSALRDRRVLGWLTCGGFGLASAGEVAIITVQRWRGVPSHFNNATSLDASLFASMGGLVGVIVAALAVLTIRSFGLLRASPSMSLAIRSGLLLLMVGQGLGAAILAHGGATVSAHPGAFVQASLFGAAGQMKVPHAVSLHAIQVLPLLAWLLSMATASERDRTRIVLRAVAGYAGLVAVSCLQTFRGIAPVHLDVATTLLAAVSVSLLVSAVLPTAGRLRRELRRMDRAAAGAGAAPDAGAAAGAGSDAVPAG
jgi:hypothetical protein